MSPGDLPAIALVQMEVRPGRPDLNADRMHEFIEEARRAGAELVVFPELALTTFFPRWVYEDEVNLDDYYETEMPSPATQTDAQSVVHGVSVLDGITIAVSELERSLR